MNDYRALLENQEFYPPVLNTIIPPEEARIAESYQNKESRFLKIVVDIYLANHKEALDNSNIEDIMGVATRKLFKIHPEQTIGKNDLELLRISLKRKVAEIRDEQSKRARIEPEAGPSYQYDPGSPSYDPVSPTYSPNASFDDSDEEEFDYQEEMFKRAVYKLEDVSNIDLKYAYSVVGYGKSGKEIELQLKTILGIKRFPEKLNLVYHPRKDGTNAQMIQVVITFDTSNDNLTQLLSKFQRDAGEDLPKLGLIVVNKNGEGVYNFHTPEPPGAEILKDFLTRRREFLPNLEIDKILENDCSEIFLNHEFEEEYEEWAKSIDDKLSANNTEKDLEKIVKGKLSSVELHSYTLLEFMSKIEPLIEEKKRQDIPSVIYKGKVMPSGYTIARKASHMEDQKNIKELVMELGRAVGEGLYQDFWNYLHDKWDGESGILANTEKIKSTKRMRIVTDHDEIFKMGPSIGIGQKKYHISKNVENTKQPEPEALERASYHPWVGEMIETLMEDTSERWFTGIQREINIDNHPMASFAEAINGKLSEDVWSSRAMATLSKITNFYSRMGGPFSQTITKGKPHSKVSIGALMSHSQPGSVRWIDGFFLRGPHHARTSTDKLGFVTFEVLDLGVGKQPPSAYLDKYSLLQTTKGFEVLIRQNSTKKADSSYSTFALNGFFILSNGIGESILQRFTTGVRSTMTCDGSINQGLQLLEDSKNYSLSLMAQVVMMTLSGNAQDEEYLATMRMLYMNIVQWSERSRVMTLSKNALIEPFNECLINSAFSIWHFLRSMTSLSKMASHLSSID